MSLPPARPKEGSIPPAGKARSAKAAPMDDVAITLRNRLAPLSPTVLEIHDDGGEHVGHVGAAGGGGHFSMLIVSDAFSGMPRLARHQRVLREVGDLLPHPVHALSIKALTPEEFPS